MIRGLHYHRGFPLAVCLALGAVLCCAEPAGADDFRQPLSAFFTRFCNECHAGGAREGGLALDELGADLGDAATFAKWERVFDRVKNGEMPPGDAEQPGKQQRASFASSLGGPLTKAHAAAKGTVLRRLNRREYKNTLNDLFGTHLDLESQLPQDGRSHEFDNVGDALGISMVQMQRYLEAADQVLDAAIATTTEKPMAEVKRATYAETREAQRHLGKQWLKLDDGAVVFFRKLSYPTGMLRTANVRRTGRYQIRVTGYAYQSDEPITFSVGATTFARGAEKPTFGYYSMPPGKPSTIELEAWISRNYMIQIEPYGIVDADYAIKNHGIENYRGPGLAILHVELKGPLVDPFPSRGHRLLLDGIDRREVEPRNPADKKKSWYQPKFEVVSQQPSEDARRVIRRVAARAFRRPLEERQVAPYVRLFEAQLEQGAGFEPALRTAVAAVLCSPEFLFLPEGAGPLDDFALASRLSYFLTRTLPDEPLVGLARAGKLTSDAETLAAEVERLLNDARSDRFVEDFTDAWLNLRDIDFTSPDRNLFPEFDPFLRYSMVEETRLFFRELIEQNLRAKNIVQSDFAMLNKRLAEHYGIAGVAGPEIRRVPLPPGSVRGGFLSQASVLKVSANGTNTSPVVRGAWVLQRILGQTPPPPPPGVPGVEPDVRGAATLRELLDKHRNLESCGVCHRQIDPPGFALESFNPIGGWRDRFRSLGEGERVNLEINGRKVRYKRGPAVDATGEMPDGRTFAGYREFREFLAADEDALARTLATKLLTFATGREMGFSDRAAIDRIVEQSRARGHGVRELIQLVVQSEVFRSK